MALKFASEKLRGNKCIVIKAIKNKCNALEFASKKLKDDEKIIY
jgi:hypothetical protein